MNNLFKNSRFFFRINIKAILFLLFIFFISIYSLPTQIPTKEAGSDSLLVQDITLIDEFYSPNLELPETFPVPKRLIIDIYMKVDAFFKFSSIKAGKLVKGMNLIEIPVDDLFDYSGSHNYILKLKSGDQEEILDIILDIKINKQLPAEISIQKPRIYEVSVFVGNTFVYSLQKVENFLEHILKEGKKIPSQEKFDPRYPVPGTKPPAVTVNPLALAATVFKGIRNKKAIKESQNRHNLHTRKIDKLFFQKDNNGNEELMEITININYQLLDKGKN